MAPTVGLAMVGFGTTAVVVGNANYLIDAYSKYAASALGAVGLVENTSIAFLPLAATAMYTDLGFQWASRRPVAGGFPNKEKGKEEEGELRIMWRLSQKRSKFISGSLFYKNSKLRKEEEKKIGIRTVGEGCDQSESDPALS